jgi:hypothetical protein
LTCRAEKGKDSLKVVFVAYLLTKPLAQVAELVDALASGASGCKVVEVRVFSWAPFLLLPSSFGEQFR